MFEEQTRRIKADRADLLERLNALNGVQARQSQANFILFRVTNAPAVFDDLKKQGILIKCLRVTVGTADENQAFLKILTKIV
ncbi:MAG: hypothetical protein ABFS56_24005 [Pseudomonadota bacterium]